MSQSRFCVLTTARSGSTFLCELLDSVPGVICQGELFHKRSIHLARRHRLELDTSLEERDRDPVDFLKTLESRAFERWPDLTASGFKLFLTHNAAVLRHVVSEGDYRVIFLRRRNLLAQYSSNLLAKQAGRWARRDPHPRFEDDVVPFDADEFRAFMTGQSKGFGEVERQLAARGAASESIYFDEIKTDAAIRRILRAIGAAYDGDLSTFMAGVSVIRENRPNIIDRFSNQKAVDRAMRELGHEEWLGSEFASDPAFAASEPAESGAPQFRPPVSTTYLGRPFSTNRWGMRDKDYERRPAAATRRIAVLGSAMVMGAGVGDGEPFEQVVEDRLNREFSPHTAARYELLNFGVPDFSLLQQTRLLESAWVGQFRPDAVLVVGHAASDLNAITRSLRKAIVHNQELPDYVAPLVRQSGARRSMPPQEIQRLLKALSGGFAEAALQAAGAAIREMNAQALFALVPAPGEPADVQARPLLISAALKAGFRAIDLHAAFAGLDVASLALEGADRLPNVEGHQVIARALYAELIKEPILLAPDVKAEAGKDDAYAAWESGMAERKAEINWRRRWRVETHKNSVATLEHSSAEAGHLRVTIARLPLPVGWHVKLQNAPVPISDGDEFQLTFRARTDTPRSIACGVEQDVHPWGSLGLYREMDIATTWASYSCRFTATGTDRNARVFLDLGTSDVAVEVADVMLRNLSASQDLMPLPPRVLAAKE